MLILVRHGRTEANAAGLLLGRLDPPLDEVGRAQAVALAASVPRPLARVVSSPLARALETARALADGAPVEVDERWTELDYGSFDGLHVSHVPSETWAAWRRDLHFAPPGGESLARLGVRVREACSSLASDAEAGHVAVVSHVSPIKAAVAWALDVSDEVSWRTRLDPGTITRVAVSSGRPALCSFNERPAPPA